VPRPIARDLLIALFAAAAFIWLAAAVLGGVPAFDTAVRIAVHGFSNPVLTACMKAFTNLGSGWLLWPVVPAIVFVLVRGGRRRDAALFAVAVLGAYFIYEGMKLLVHRTRPDPFFGMDRPSSYSFPSGHAFLSFCFYLTLAEVLVRPEWPARWRRLAWAGAILLTLSIGFSRIYLGVHYPSDVLAGYAGAIAWTSVVRAAHKTRRS
jgi:undecaprenyl-diphosphatase